MPTFHIAALLEVPFAPLLTQVPAIVHGETAEDGHLF